jgi:hypothetical protein
MSNNMTEDYAKTLSNFTTDKDLAIDDFIVFQDIDIAHLTMMDRYYTLLNKTYTTDAEKAEMTTLLTQLEQYMPTSLTWNKLCACIKTMQMFIRDGIVMFINEKQTEFKNILSNYKYMEDWSSTINYSIGNGVRHNGYGFYCISDNNLNNEPNIEIANDSNWVRFTIKGDKGDPSLNINYRGEYDSTKTYNLSNGDAVTYSGNMYYAKIDGLVGILPTDKIKWACANNIVISDTNPLDTNVIWWDINSNKFKRYTSNMKWEAQVITAGDISLIDKGNYFNSTDLENAFAEVGLNLKNINDKINLLSEDSNQKLLWRGNKVGATNANEIGLSTISGLDAKNVQDGLSQLFQYANNGKTSIANVVGYVTSSNTHSQIANEIQYDKNILANNLVNKGISATGTSGLRDLASAVANITVKSLGGRKLITGSFNPITSEVFYNSSGVAVTMYVFDVSGFDFIPTTILIYSPRMEIRACLNPYYSTSIIYCTDDNQVQRLFRIGDSKNNGKLIVDYGRVRIPWQGDSGDGCYYTIYE